MRTRRFLTVIALASAALVAGSGSALAGASRAPTSAGEAAPMALAIAGAPTDAVTNPLTVRGAVASLPASVGVPVAPERSRTLGIVAVTLIAAASVVLARGFVRFERR